MDGCKAVREIALIVLKSGVLAPTFYLWWRLIPFERRGLVVHLVNLLR